MSIGVIVNADTPEEEQAATDALVEYCAMTWDMVYEKPTHEQVREAILAERDRCAKIAEDVGDAYDTSVGREIARRIRAGEEKPK